MKKQLLNLSFIAVALGLYVTVASSQLVAPTNTMDVNYAEAGTMIMDGTDDEVAYSALETTDIFNPTGNPTGDASDFSASFKLAFDRTYLYLYAVMTDDVEADYAWGVGNSYQFDGCEVFLQLDTMTVPSSYNSRTIQLRICRELDSVETAGRAARADYDYHVENTSDGWLTETAIPWTCVLEVGDTLSIEDYRNVQIGFDFQGADDDDTDGDPAVGNRDCQTMWDNDDPSDDADRTEDNAWNNTTVFGRITLNLMCCSPGYSESLLSNALELLPNPATNAISIKNLQTGSSIEVYNMLGVKMMNIEQAGTETAIDISALKCGLYTAVINRKETVRFIKE